MILCLKNKTWQSLLKLILIAKILIVNCDVQFTAHDPANIQSRNFIEYINRSESLSNDDQNLYRKVYGKLIYAKSYEQALLNKILNKSDTYQKAACYFSYGNNTENNTQPIGLVHRSELCSLDVQVDNAIRNNATALIVINFSNISNQLSGNYRLTGYPIQVILIRNLFGERLVSLLDNNGTVFVSIEYQSILIITSKSNDKATNQRQSESPNVKFTNEKRSTIGAASIIAIVFGILFVFTLLVGLFIIFYYIQKSKVMEEHEKVAKMIEKMLKGAISRMKCKELKPTDKECVNDESCIICLENFQPKETIRILPCGHYFHKHEIDQWININHTCPVCKIDILKADVDRKKSSWAKMLVKLKLSRSDSEMNEALRMHQNYRRNTLYSLGDMSSSNRYTAINQLTITSVVSTEETRTRAFLEFVNMNSNRTNNEQNSTWSNLNDINAHASRDDDMAPRRRIKRINFFGERLDDFEIDEQTSHKDIPQPTTDDPTSADLDQTDQENIDASGQEVEKLDRVSINEEQSVSFDNSTVLSTKLLTKNDLKTDE